MLAGTPSHTPICTCARAAASHMRSRSCQKLSSFPEAMQACQRSSRSPCEQQGNHSKVAATLQNSVAETWLCRTRGPRHNRSPFSDSPGRQPGRLSSVGPHGAARRSSWTCTHTDWLVCAYAQSPGTAWSRGKCRLAHRPSAGLLMNGSMQPPPPFPCPLWTHLQTE